MQALNRHPKYRADIDGLRAIAVLSVVGFHAFPNWVKGGFIGVDIFFVISGFLISTIIFSGLTQGCFSFVEFYSRRIKRIFPALLLVLITSTALGWFVLLPDEYKQLGKHVASGAGFISNFILWNENGYFDNAAETKPLLHLWSLGIEEQFYIVWPLLIWLAWKNKFNILTLTIAISIISFVLNIAMLSHIVAVFYWPLPRFWELTAGSVLAYIKLHKQDIFPPFSRKIDKWLGIVKANGDRLRNVQSMLGAALITTGFFVITKERHFPGWWALLPTVGTVFIISADTQAWFNRIVLSHRLLIWFGLISFPLYLWHWPLLSFAYIIENETPARDIRIAIVLISIVLAWLTYKLIEKPIRLGSHSNAKTITLLVLMLVVGGIGYDGYKRELLNFRASNFLKIIKATRAWQYPGKLKPFTFKERVFYYEKKSAAKTTLFIGDSNMQQYYPRIDELLKNHSLSTNNVIFSTDASCLPIPNIQIDIHPHCFDLLEKSLQLALLRNDITSVVIGGQWYGYLAKNQLIYFTNERQKYVVNKGTSGYYKALAELANYIDILIKHKKKVFLILNIPIGNALDPKFRIQRSIKDFPQVLKIRDSSISLKTLDEKYGFIRNDLIRIADEHHATVIDPVAHLCKNDICPSVDEDNDPIYKDASHLTPEFVRNKATFVDLTVFN